VLNPSCHAGLSCLHNRACCGRRRCVCTVFTCLPEGDHFSPASCRLQGRRFVGSQLTGTAALSHPAARPTNKASHSAQPFHAAPGPALGRCAPAPARRRTAIAQRLRPPRCQEVYLLTCGDLLHAPQPCFAASMEARAAHAALCTAAPTSAAAAPGCPVQLPGNDGQPSCPTVASGGGDGSGSREMGHTSSSAPQTGQLGLNWRSLQRQQQPEQQAARQQQQASQGWGTGDLMRHVEQATCLFVLGVQTVLWARTASVLTPRGHVHQLAQVALQAGCLVLALCLPREAWCRYR